MVLFVCTKSRVATIRALQEHLSPDLLRVVFALTLTREHTDRADLWQRRYLARLSAKRVKILFTSGFIPADVLDTCERTATGNPMLKCLQVRWLDDLNKTGDTLTLARAVHALFVASPGHALFETSENLGRIFSEQLHAHEHELSRRIHANERRVFVNYLMLEKRIFNVPVTSQLREAAEALYDAQIAPPPPFVAEPSWYIF
jgi:hypothetical protein